MTLTEPELDRAVRQALPEDAGERDMEELAELPIL